jgi:hypothetical protein
MISSSLSRRLERLETSIIPTSTTSNPVVLELRGTAASKTRETPSQQPLHAIPAGSLSSSMADFGEERHRRYLSRVNSFERQQTG